MWELIYEDTFGFGEDRDPPRIEKKGHKGQDGFFQLWMIVLDEGLSISHGKPVAGFASFTLHMDFPNGNSKSHFHRRPQIYRIVGKVKTRSKSG